MENKPDEAVYLGVDLIDKEYLDLPEKNVYTMVCDSFKRDRVRNRLNELGVKKVDLLMIDGWHSVNAVVNDWQYSELLSDNGVILMHDTNCHTGPVAVVDAIDRKLWKVKKYCLEKKQHRKKKVGLVFADWGIAVVKRKK
jgi:hypothetical protein